MEPIGNKELPDPKKYYENRLAAKLKGAQTVLQRSLKANPKQASQLAENAFQAFTASIEQYYQENLKQIDEQMQTDERTYASIKKVYLTAAKQRFLMQASAIQKPTQEEISTLYRADQFA